MAFGAESGRLLGDLATRPSSPDELADAARAFVEAAVAAPSSVSRDALDGLAPALGRAEGEPLVILANVVGYLGEQGVKSESTANAFADRLVAVAASARAFADAARLEGADASNDGDGDEDHEAFEAARLRIADRFPAEAASWEAMAGLLAPALAIVDESGPARHSAQRCLPDLDGLAPHHVAAHWLGRFLRVLYDEPFLAIEPATRAAIRGRLSGISENFQLNVLLMDAFPKSGFLARPRVSKGAVANARGEGPQEIDEVVTGAWDTFAWTALQADGSLPTVGHASFMDHAIWNEGTPSDIPSFEGWRVILLGPASYERSWRAQRDFPRLAAGLNDVERLATGETQAWIERLKATANGRGDT